MFNVPDPNPIQEEYLAAIREMNSAPKNTPFDILQGKMLPHFQVCYSHIKKQLGIIFSVDDAAKYEFQLFMAHHNDAPSHEIIDIMNNLYASILGGDCHDYQIASEKRTALFKMKQLYQRNGAAQLTPKQKEQMIILHGESELILNQHIKLCQAAILSETPT